MKSPFGLGKRTARIRVEWPIAISKCGKIRSFSHADMTSRRLYGMLKIVDSLDRELGLQTSLQTIRDALNNLVKAPAQPNCQNAVEGALTSFTSAAARMTQSISSSQAAVIQQMGGAEFFDPAIAGRVAESIQTNAMTPSVARDFVQDLATRRSAFLKTVRTALQSLEDLGFADSGLKPGMAEVDFLIPREIFGNDLGSFAKELSFICRLLQDFTKARTGKVEPVTLGQLSSSVPAVTLAADPAVLSQLGAVISKFLGAWDKVEKIRQMREQLAEMGLEGIALQELTGQITSTVNEAVEQSTQLVIANYNGDRKRELENAIRVDTRRLFGQIERGLTVEFRAEPKPGADEPKQKSLKQIASLAKELKFPQAAKEPLVLKGGEVLEDESGAARRTRRTTGRKTTTPRKQSQDETKDETKQE